MAIELIGSDGHPVVRNGQHLLASISTGVVKSVDVAKRLMWVTGSTEARDRDGDIITVKGWQLDNFLKNPVFLWAHNYSGLPIGGARKVLRRKDPVKLDFLIHFADLKDLWTFPDVVMHLYKDLKLNATSVVFIPMEFEPIQEKDDSGSSPRRGRRYLKQELLELSGCAVPSNPEALSNSLAADPGFLKLSEQNRGMFLDMLIHGPKAIDRSDEIRGEITQAYTSSLEFEDELSPVQVQVPVQITETVTVTQSLPVTVPAVAEENALKHGHQVAELEDEMAGKSEGHAEDPMKDLEEVKYEEDDVGIPVLRPYPNEHACRLNDPAKYDSFRRQNDKFGPGIHVIFGIKDNTAEIQAIRFDKDQHPVAEAKKWLKDHGHKCISFEPASAGAASLEPEPDDHGFYDSLFDQQQGEVEAIGAAPASEREVQTVQSRLPQRQPMGRTSQLTSEQVTRLNQSIDRLYAALARWSSAASSRWRGR